MLRKFLSSLRHAMRGISIVFRTENSFRLQVLSATAILFLVIIVPLDIWQKLLLILMTAAVLVLEMLNTIFERISDILKPRLHPLVKEIKDIMAGAVLITSLTSIVVALFIFGSFFGWL